MLKTIIKERIIPSIFDIGWGNGYVILPKGHKYHGVHYDKIDVDVHGDLTYGEIITEKTLPYFCGLTKEDIGSYMVGFDTAHYGDNPIQHDEEYVKAETENLREQLEDK